MSGIDAELIGTDISHPMITIARSSLNLNVDLIVCDGFNLPLRKETKFDIIHMAFILHHLIDKTKYQSTNLVRRMLSILKGKLSKNAILIRDETYYDSYIFPGVTSTMIFYGLKLLNYLRFDVSKISSHIQLGLEVNFMHTAQIESILDELGGNVNILKKNAWKIPTILSSIPASGIWTHYYSAQS